MEVVIVSEHYFPIVGGTSFLTKHIAEAVGRRGVMVHLVVPGSSQVDEISINGEVTIHKIGIGSSIKVDLEKKHRLSFLEGANKLIKALIVGNDIRAVHVLCGLYSMRHLDIPYFRKKGLLAYATIVNVPPQECGSSWSGDQFKNRIIDRIRKVVVKYVNKRRILWNTWDGYFAISNCGKRLLSEYIDPKLIEVVPLGCDATDISPLIGRPRKRLNILTVAGYLPHKNQHLIPAVANELRVRGIDFKWTMIGPVRVKGYFDYVAKSVNKLNLANEVEMHTAMPQLQVYKFYSEADIYVQPSLEEGFCLAALDSILFSLPLIGVKGNSGSIAEFVEIGKGVMTVNSYSQIADAICRIMREPEAFIYSDDDKKRITEKYSWDNVVLGYINAYRKNG